MWRIKWASRVSGSVVKDHSEREPLARPQGADAVSVLDAIISACAAHGTVADWEDDCVALLQWDDFGSRLPSRPLLGQNELAAGELRCVRQQDRDLNREKILAVHILV